MSTNTEPPLLCCRCGQPVGIQWIMYNGGDVCRPCYDLDFAQRQMTQLPPAQRLRLLLELLAYDDIRALVSDMTEEQHDRQQSPRGR